MKEMIFNNLARGVALGALAFFGLRGVLPDIAAAGNFSGLLYLASALIVGFAVVPPAYQSYRCASRCESTCDPQFCKAT